MLLSRRDFDGDTPHGVGLIGGAPCSRLPVADQAPNIPIAGSRQMFELLAHRYASCTVMPSGSPNRLTPQRPCSDAWPQTQASHPNIPETDMAATYRPVTDLFAIPLPSAWTINPLPSLRAVQDRSVERSGISFFYGQWPTLLPTSRPCPTAAAPDRHRPCPKTLFPDVRLGTAFSPRGYRLDWWELLNHIGRKRSAPQVVRCALMIGYARTLEGKNFYKL